MNAGNPIIAAKPGGLTRQAVDHRDGSENGVALDIDCKTLVGCQQVPYIYEDYVSADTIADAIFRMYKEGPEGRKKLGQKAKDYAHYEFDLQDTIDAWDKTMKDCLETFWSDKNKSWSCETL